MNRLIEAIPKGNADEIITIVKNDPGAVHSRDENGLGCVSIAIYHNKPEIARLLIQLGAPVTFFEHCALGDLCEVQEELLQSPSLMDQFSVDGFQGLGLAAFLGQVDVVEYLIKAGANVNSPSSNKMRVTPLHSAIAAHHMHISEMLLEADANVDAAQQDGYTCLHAAAADGQLEMVQLLLCFGAKKDVHLDDGRSPLQLAREKGHSEIVALLED